MAAIEQTRNYTKSELAEALGLSETVIEGFLASGKKTGLLSFQTNEDGEERVSGAAWVKYIRTYPVSARFERAVQWEQFRRVRERERVELLRDED